MAVPLIEAFPRDNMNQTFIHHNCPSRQALAHAPRLVPLSMPYHLPLTGTKPTCTPLLLDSVSPIVSENEAQVLSSPHPGISAPVSGLNPMIS